MAKKQNVIGGKAAAEQAAAMQERKKRFAIIGGTIGGLLVIAAIILLIISLKPKTDAYEVAEEIYAAHKISYTKEDYTKDKQAIDNNTAEVSDSYSKMRKKNNKIINNILKDYGEDPDNPDIPQPVTPEGEDVDMDAWCKALIAQLATSNEHINKHYGLEEVSFISKQGDKEFDARPLAYEDITNTENFIAGGSKQTMKYWALTHEQLGAGLRVSAYTPQQFTMELANSAEREQINLYKKWFMAKHPVFTKIYTVSLTERYDDIDSTHTSQLYGEIVTDNGNYVVYSTLTMNMDRTYSFKFYDVGVK